MPKKSVLFICLGNICRSPIAEAIFRHQVNEKGLADQWHIDSAAIGGWHVGNGPDENAVRCLEEKGGLKSDHIVRQISKADFTTFDVIFGMDDDNMRTLNNLKPKDGTAKLELLGDYDPEGERIIVDPYYLGYKDFLTVYDQCVRCCGAFLKANS